MYISVLVKEILDMSRIEFNHEFNKTYYSPSNTVFLQQFDSFFMSLKHYYSEYQVSLKDIVRKLFINVARMILSFKSKSNINHGNSKLNNDQCLELLLDYDIRMEIEKKLEKSLDSVRLFSAVLTKLRDVIIELYAKFDSNSSNSKQCISSLTQIYSCSMCLSDELMVKKQSVRPCYRDCIDTYKSCISFDFSKLDPVWNSYISMFNRLVFILESN